MVRSKITKIPSRVSLKRTPRHAAVPPRGFHHPHPPSASASASAAASAAAPAEADHHRQSHGGDDPRQRKVEPAPDRVAPCLRRKHAVEPTQRLAAEILHRQQSFLQLLHHELHHLLHPHLSLSLHRVFNGIGFFLFLFHFIFFREGIGIYKRNDLQKESCTGAPQVRKGFD